MGDDANGLPYALPPDPNTRAPTWILPDGACDTHFHIFGPPDKFPFAETRRYTPPGGPLENYRKVQEITGLARGIAVQPSAHGFDNSAVLDAVARSGGNMRAVVRFNEKTTDAELDALHDAGARGARFSLMSDRPGSISNLEAALPRMERLGWSLVLQAEPDHLVDNETIIRNIPIPTVVDHMARCKPSDGGIAHPAFALLLDLLKDDRFWVKIASVDKISALKQSFVPGEIQFSDTIPMGEAVIAAAPDRVIWGSDWPHGNTFEPGRIPNDGDLLNVLGAMAPGDAQRRKILVDNPTRLYFT